MADMQIYPLRVNPGIQQDGTRFASNSWLNGIWTRFQRGLPQKIGGVQVINHADLICRGTYLIADNQNFNIYSGTANNLTYITVDQFGTMIGVLVDRTPVGFHDGPNNLWQFDTMFSTTDNGSILIANAPPNLSAINNSIERTIYYGDANATTPLLDTGLKTSGGISVFHPYLFIFDNDGGVRWTNANDPTTIMDGARVTASKIVAGLPTRGGGNSPAGLMWSLDSLIRVTNIGTNEPIFNFDTITTESSILSSRCIIEYDSEYYWCGTDRFLMYNGVVQEVPNDKNINFFFRNLNYSQRQKVWATKVTQYGEIWWHFPFGNAIECNHAIIYNVREKTWYDTACNYASGYFDQIFSKPIWCSSNSFGSYYHTSIQEIGTDHVHLDGTANPITAAISTCDISYLSTLIDGQQNSELNRLTEISRVEPDFIQTGPMTLFVSTRQYANSNLQTTTYNPYTFLPTTEKMDMREMGREIQLTFDSAVLGGYFEMGKIMVIGRPGDVRA